MTQLQEYRQIEEAYSEIADLVVQTVATEITAPQSDLSPETQSATIAEHSTVTTEPIYEMYAPITVDFETLLGINPDIVGWLYCEGTSINYPVLQGLTNETYLYHQYDGSYSSGGSIFMDFRCSNDFSDPYSIIYGHNMLSDTMFNSLDYFRKQSYLEEHPVFYLLTPNGNFCLEVVCCNLVSKRDDLFELRLKERCVEDVIATAESSLEVEVQEGDRLILLSTCTYDFKDARCTLLCRATPAG